MDALSVSGAAHDFTISGSAKLGLLDDLVAAGKPLGLAFTPDPDPAAGHFYRSDHFSFAKRGVPAVSVESGRDLVEGGKARGDALAQTYVRDHYHQPSDEWHADWNWQGVTQTLTLVYDVGAEARHQPRMAELERRQRIPRGAHHQRRRSSVATHPPSPRLEAG